MSAIFKKECQTLFQNVIGWLFIGVTLALFGLYFFVYQLSYGHPYISYSLSAISFVFMITVPILTMRTIAEERRAKTDRLLLTSPVSLGKILLGKFLALGAVYSLCILIISIAPVILRIFGEVPLLETYVGVFGFWLYGLSCIAIGVFASSLTESQVVSAVLSFVLLFLGYMMSSLCSVFTGKGELFADVLGCYDLYAPLDEFLNGTFSLTGVVYYISIIAMALFFAYQSMQKRRWSVSKKMLSTSVFSISMTVICTLAVIGINFGVQQIPAKYTEIDATSKQIYSITKETKDYLKTLKKDVTIYVYADKKEKDENVDKTLSKYEGASKHITVTYINPDTNPGFAEKYADSDISRNSLIVVCGKQSKVIPYGTSENSFADGKIYQYTMDASTYSYVPTGYDCEGQVTAAIQYVTTEKNITVYELKGHDEATLGNDVTEIFHKSFINVASLNLLQADEVPKDCAALFISAPQTDLSADDLKKIEAYIDNGGAVYYGIDYQNFDKLENFKKLLAYYNIAATEGIVGEEDANYYYQNCFYLLPEVANTEISSEVAGTTSVFAPYAVGLRYTLEDDNGEDGSCVRFMYTSQQSFAKVYENLKKEREESEQQKLFTKEAGDTDGPFDLGLLVTNDNGGKLVVVGSAYMFTDSANEMVSGRNAKLFHGIVNTMITTETGEDNAVVIAAKDYSIPVLTVSQRAVFVYGLLWGIFMPLAAIVVGIIIWARRRKL